MFTEGATYQDTVVTSLKSKSSGQILQTNKTVLMVTVNENYDCSKNSDNDYLDWLCFGASPEKLYLDEGFPAQPFLEIGETWSKSFCPARELQYSLYAGRWYYRIDTFH